MTKIHKQLVEGRFDGWVPPPDCLIETVVIPVETDELPRRNCGFDKENELYYRVISSQWWQHWHWRLRSGGWLHCREKFSYDPHVKYVHAVDGEYKEKSVRWYSDFNEAVASTN